MDMKKPVGIVYDVKDYLYFRQGAGQIIIRVLKDIFPPYQHLSILQFQTTSFALVAIPRERFYKKLSISSTQLMILRPYPFFIENESSE
jgi:hypothetical protein